MSRIPVGIFVLACVGLCAPASAQQGSPTPPLPVGGQIKAPTKIKDVPPVYPLEAQRAGISGVVILEATIGEDGKVRQARVLRSIPQLDQAAIDAVRQWEYTPTLINGVAVPILITVTVNFSQGAPPQGSLSSLPSAAPGTFRLLAMAQNGRPQVWDIVIARVSTLPAWNGESEPPLSIGEAARIARNWIVGQKMQISGLTLRTINLIGRPLPGPSEVWYYQVSYSSAGAPLATAGPPVVVVVLFDGSVLEPKDIAEAP